MNLILTGVLLLVLIALVIWVGRLPMHRPPDPDKPFNTHLQFWLEIADAEAVQKRPEPRIRRWASQIPDLEVREMVLFKLLPRNRA